jgi:hypothetical protein
VGELLVVALECDGLVVAVCGECVDQFVMGGSGLVIQDVAVA